MHGLMAALRMLAVALLAVANFAIRLFSARDYMLFAGLGLMAYGLTLVYLPAAYIVPGTILAAVAIAISFKGAN